MEKTPTPVAPQGQSMFAGASPKLTFWFGFIGGAAVAGLLSLIFVVLPYGGSAKTKTVAAVNNDTNSVAPSNTNSAPALGNPKAISKDDYVLGTGKLTLVEYSDLECPYCKQFHPVMTQARDDYKGKVKEVYRHFPLSFHQNAQKEAEAALCIGSLGGSQKYWDFVDKIFERTTSNGTGFALTALGPLAKEVGVNQAKFQTCLDSGQMAARVSAETSDGSSIGVQGTPTTFLIGPDGKTITGFPGAYSYAQIKSAIDSALATI